MLLLLATREVGMLHKAFEKGGICQPTRLLESCHDIDASKCRQRDTLVGTRDMNQDAVSK